MLSSTSLFKYEPIQQFRADQSGFFADEARRRNAETQRAVGTAAAKAAVPTTEEPKLLRTERTPELSSAFKGLFDPLQSAVKSQMDFTKQLQSQQAMINPRLQAAMLEDVGRVTTDLGDVEQTYGRLQQQGSEAIAARQAEAKREAMGVVERQLASRSGLGAGSEMAKIIADRVAAASIPAALQQVQFSAGLADWLARQRAASLGQRQGLLAQGYGYMQDMMTGPLKPISGALNLLGQAGAVDRALNIYGFGGETGQNPYSLPVYMPRLSTPAVRYPQPYSPPAPVSRVNNRPPPQDDPDKVARPQAPEGIRMDPASWTLYLEDQQRRSDQRQAELELARRNARGIANRRWLNEYPQFEEEDALYRPSPFDEEDAYFNTLG